MVMTYLRAAALLILIASTGAWSRAAQSNEVVCGASSGSQEVTLLQEPGSQPPASPTPGQKLLPTLPLGSPSFGALLPPDESWVESTLAAMSLQDKLGQMIMPTYAASTADSLVTTQKVGGFVFLGNNNTASAVLAATNHLQDITSVPLLFAIDCEAGLGARVVDATRFPMNMSAAATEAPALAELQGKVTARECRAVGVHIGFGPVVDVNTEPINPIIGIRSYGDNTTMVAKMAAAYVRGANSEGLLCTCKHFPGHGATTGDSHNSLPVVNVPRDVLEEVHVAPYRMLLAQGLGDLVMSAHVWYPALDPGTTAWPATLSTNALTGILRSELQYDGVVISDSFGMAGLLAAASTYDAARIGVQAGLDIILMPNNVDDAINGLRDAVQSGAISQQRIDQSVRRILQLKSRVGLPATAKVSPATMAATVGHPHHRNIAETIARRTCAAANVNSQEFPTTQSQRVLCLALDASSSIFYLYSGSYFLDEFARHHALVTTQTVATNVSSSQRSQILALAASHDRVIVVSRDWKPTISTNQQTLVQSLIDSGKPVAYCSLGSPYHINLFSGLRNFYCGFSSHYEIQRQMARVLAGVAELTGNWPVTMPGGMAVVPVRDMVPTVDSSVAEWALYESP